MSPMPTTEPVRADSPAASALATILEARSHDIGGLTVGRVLPAIAHRMVGPFIFFDHMGPAVLPAGSGLDVRPHPHIGLATVTYLFEGEIIHRDSLGSQQPIRPGDINWMTAGAGIVHSERTGPEQRARGSRLHGLQLWVALPAQHEETAPHFQHHAAETLPTLEHAGAEVRLLAGEAYGRRAPVTTFSPLFYADVSLLAGTEFPVTDEYSERAAYVVQGDVACARERAGPGRMLLFAAGAAVALRTTHGARLVLIGGEPVGERHIYWNFVASSRERIEQAKRDWREGRFPKIPGDDLEFIPLPEST